MLNLQNGQCGTCVHFGAELSDGRPAPVPTDDDKALGLVEPCTNPKHATFALKVTPISGCADFVGDQMVS